MDGQDYPKKLIIKDDNNFWTWLHNSYHEYSFENTVPNGVLPDFDLRTFFKGTYLSDHKVIDTNALRKYFADFGFHNLKIGNFVSFNPSAFGGLEISNCWQQLLTKNFITMDSLWIHKKMYYANRMFMSSSLVSLTSKQDELNYQMNKKTTKFYLE